jgi:dephospho-CoA kinase
MPELGGPILIIGLTGGIATGKSTVSKTLQDLNITVIDADKIAHDVLKREDVKQKIVNKFGHRVLDPEGNINRKKLGQIVFDHKKKLRELEEITHPKILDIIKERIDNFDKQELIVLDAPLLFETSLDDIVDESWVIYTSQETQIKRLKSRDGLDREEALKRIEAQMPLAKKKQKADILIENEGSIQELKDKINKLVEKKR